MKRVFKLLLKSVICWYYKIPIKYKNVWYNQSCYISDRNYPIVFDDKKRYIPCHKGLLVVMGKTEEGENIYYRVTKCWNTIGGDWLFGSDAVNCDLEFSYIK